MTPAAWMRANIIPALLIAATLCCGAMVVWNLWQGRQTAKTETSLAKGQAGAALESGKDAVETVGNRAASDAEADRVTQENADAIRNAAGASDQINPETRNAGIAALCRRAAYRSDPRCR